LKPAWAIKQGPAIKKTKKINLKREEKVHIKKGDRINQNKIKKTELPDIKTHFKSNIYENLACGNRILSQWEKDD
jgi:hypothetical protein